MSSGGKIYCARYTLLGKHFALRRKQLLVTPLELEETQGYLHRPQTNIGAKSYKDCSVLEISHYTLDENGGKAIKNTQLK